MKGFPTITRSYRLWRVWQAEKYEAKNIYIYIYLEQRKYEPRAHLLGETLPQFFFYISPRRKSSYGLHHRHNQMRKQTGRVTMIAIRAWMKRKVAEKGVALVFIATTKKGNG